jgi:hypothetical protein
LGLIFGGAVANVGNWAVTHAVADFLVMPWATVNLADIFILLGSAVVLIGSGARARTHYTTGTLKLRRRLPGKSTRPELAGAERALPLVGDQHLCPRRTVYELVISDGA